MVFPSFLTTINDGSQFVPITEHAQENIYLGRNSEMTDRPTELYALNMMGSEKWYEIWGCSIANPR